VFWFVLIATVAVDLILLGADLANGAPIGTVGGPLLDSWKFAKSLLATAGLLVVAWRARSVGWGLLAGVFLSIGVQDRLSWHRPLGRWLADRFDLTWLTRLIPVSASEWGAFLAMLGAALMGGAMVILAWRSHPPLRRAAALLGLLLGMLFVFAAGFDLWGAARPGLPLGWVEELGESSVLSVALSYVAGLVALGRSWLSSPRLVSLPRQPGRTAS
jgi:hypothetical protein